MPVGSPSHDWRYVSEPEQLLQSRRIEHPRGKVLGGSTSINGMLYTRGNRADYDRWAKETGTEEWDYAHCLPYFRRLEGRVGEAEDAFRGRSGPHHLVPSPTDGPIFDAFFEAARQAATPCCRHQRCGAGGLRAARPGVRERAAGVGLAGLPVAGARARQPRRPHPGLVTKVESRAPARSACASGRRGRDARAGGRGRAVRGGAIGSPQILQLSGIGDAAHLRGARRPRGAPPARRRRVAAGPLRRAHPAHLHAAGVDGSVRSKSHWPKIVVEALLFGKGPGAWNPMRGRRLRPQRRRSRATRTCSSCSRRSRCSATSGRAGRPARLPDARRGDALQGARPVHPDLVPDPAAHPSVQLNFLSGPRTGPLARRPRRSPATCSRSRRCRPRRRRVAARAGVAPRRGHGVGAPHRPGRACTCRAARGWAPVRGRCSTRHDAGARSRRPARGRRVGVAVAHQRQHLRAHAELAEKAADIVLGNPPLAPEYPAVPARTGEPREPTD